MGGVKLGARRPGAPKRQCTARNRRGTRCKSAPILGGTVCRLHGGKAPQVVRKAQERLADLIDPDRVLRELVAATYSDLRQAFDDKGRLLPMHQWPEGLARACASVKVTKKNLTAGDGKQDDVVELRLWPKIEALGLLMRHLKMLTDKLEHTGADGKPLMGDTRAMPTEALLEEAEKLAAIVLAAKEKK